MPAVNNDVPLVRPHVRACMCMRLYVYVHVFVVGAGDCGGIPVLEGDHLLPTLPIDNPTLVVFVVQIS